tara:strand:- start:253 stop:447 length:195 start_codon:yes stop_codon:yes gene_type:complete
MTYSDWKKHSIDKADKTKLFEDLEQDALSIIGCSTNLIEAIKERDKRIKNLELQIETINKPLKK